MLYAAILAIALAISPSSNDERTLINAIEDECNWVQDATDADYCAYQYTDMSAEAGVITARVQFTLGCETPFGAAPNMQEAEYIVSVSLRDGEMTKADRIDSPHLIDGGVTQFTRMYCDVIES